ncbi:MAG: hypothetical protein ACREQF_05660, partial [Candidatus Binataceae bacterium]
MQEAGIFGGEPRRHHSYAGAGRPALFSSSEIDELRKLLKLVARRIEPLLQLTFQLYLASFSERQALSAISFFDVFRPALLDATEHLLARRVDQFILDVVKLGETLANRRVPFEELVACCHLMT